MRVSIPRRVLRGFRERHPDVTSDPLRLIQVSIPRRVLRGFRVLSAIVEEGGYPLIVGFNTPEGVEGFSRLDQEELCSDCYAVVSIPRRVLRGFRDELDPRVRAAVDASFNTPEGVEGFSRL